MRCDVLAIGTELLLGQIVDTNSAWIGEQLAASGIDTYEHRKVGDNLDADRRRRCASCSTAPTRCIVCGGLGPTPDDLTRDAIAEVMGVSSSGAMELVEHIAHDVRRPRLRDMPQNNLRQADIPEGGDAIPNPIGTAPGLRCPVGDGKVVYAVPGVPYEMQQMVTEHVLPDLLRALGRGRGDRVALAEDVGHVGVGARRDDRAPPRRARRSRQPDDRVPRPRHRRARRAHHRQGARPRTRPRALLDAEETRAAQRSSATSCSASTTRRWSHAVLARLRGARLDARRRRVAHRRAHRRAHRQRARRERHVPRLDRRRTRPR